MAEMPNRNPNPSPRFIHFDTPALQNTLYPHLTRGHHGVLSQLLDWAQTQMPNTRMPNEGLKCQIEGIKNMLITGSANVCL